MLLPPQSTGIGLMALCGLSAYASQLSLSPVYGSLPVSLYHTPLLALCIATSFILHTWLRRYDLRPFLKLLPLFAVAVPTLQTRINRSSSRFGAALGPAVTECVTLCPLLLISSLFVLDIHWKSTARARNGVLSLVCLALPFVVQQVAPVYLYNLAGVNVALSRAGLQYSLATLYTILLPSNSIAVACLGFYFALHDVHMPFPTPTAALNRGLEVQKWTLLDRVDSNTSYISVLEHGPNQLRVLRCDHSILGGEWLVDSNARQHGIVVPEPVYPVFVLLEAVRLIRYNEEDRELLKNTARSALVIGLGIGTSSKALVAHGITTTTIELDPAVGKFAEQYFDLPRNHSLVIDDATSYVPRAVQSNTKFDHVMHDVFTGGSSPSSLFSREFLSQLKDLLQPSGSIAINYVGDIQKDSTKVVLSTIQSVFGSCKLFGENEHSGKDGMANLVTICTAANASWSFRNVEDSDLLQSQARRRILPPRYPIPWPAAIPESERASTIQQRAAQEAREGAMAHWQVMRKALPPLVWEYW